MSGADLRRSSIARPLAAAGRIGVLALLCLGLACAGDGMMRLPRLLGGSVTDASGNSVESVAPLAYGEWQKDVLDCEAGRCQNVYGVIASRGGTLKAQVFAPFGSSDAPDFELVLLDRNGEPIKRPVEPYELPRKLEAPVEPGSYFLRVASRGTNNSRLRYELVANFEPKGKPSRQAVRPSQPQRTAPKASRTPGPTPVVQEVANRPPSTPIPAASSGSVIKAEVLDVEELDGVPAYVLLDAGGPGVSLGMRGRLVDGGNAIAEIVIIEVFPDGSRAELTGTPSGEFSIDTIADIYEE